MEMKRMGFKERSTEIEKIKDEIEQLRTNKNTLEQDLILVTEPFGIDYRARKEAHQASGVPRQGRQNKRGDMQYLVSQQNQ